MCSIIHLNHSGALARVAASGSALSLETRNVPGWSRAASAAPPVPLTSSRRDPGVGGSVVYLLLHTRHDSATAGDSPLEATLSICCDCHLSRQLRCTNAELPLHSQGFTSGSSPSLYGECMKKRRFVVLSEAQLAGNSAS